MVRPQKIAFGSPDLIKQRSFTLPPNYGEPIFVARVSDRHFYCLH